MKIERFEIKGLAQYSYVISSNGKAVVLDPMRDIDRYTDYAAAEELQITHVIETHIHADYASGALALSRTTGAQLLLSGHDEAELYQYAFPHTQLNDRDIFDVADLRFQALHTPGHTPEHLSFLLFDTARNAAEPLALFSGDFLFVGSVGRPDLLGDQEKHRLAHELFDSLHRRVDWIPDSVQLYPGHGAGSLCGAGLSELPESTLGYERKTNPLFHKTEERFIAEALQTLPPIPRYYPRMKQLNAVGAPTLQTLPGQVPISAAEVSRLIESEGAVILDLRGPEAFGGAHIPNAINIGASQNLSLWAGWLLEPNRPLILVNDSGDDEDSRRALIRVGLDNIIGYLDHGMAAWIDAGLPLQRTTQLSTDDASHLSHDSEFIDVRSQTEWNDGHILGAKHIPLGELQNRLQELPLTKKLITICGSGYRSSIAASLIARNGFRHVCSLSGGMAAWKRRQMPLII